MIASGSADPPHTRRVIDGMPPPSVARSTASAPAQIVGTPAPSVTFSLLIRFTSDAGCMCRSGSTMSAPASSAAYASPHAFAWNIGTTGRTRSCSDSAKALPRQGAIECR
jgi:hypothetical protein